MFRCVARSSIPLQPPKRPLVIDTTSSGVDVHWVGAVPTEFDARNMVKAIQQQHLNDPNTDYSDIAYSHLLDLRDGMFYEGRGWYFQHGATKGSGSTSRSLCLLAGEETPGDLDSIYPALDNEAKLAIRTYVIEHDRLFGKGFVRGHRQAPGNATGCPGNQVVAWLDAGMPLDLLPQPPKPPEPDPEEDMANRQFITHPGTFTWWITDGLTRRPLETGEAQRMVDLGVVKPERRDDGSIKVKEMPQAAVERIPLVK